MAARLRQAKVGMLEEADRCQPREIGALQV